MLHHARIGTGLVIERHRRRRHLLIAGALAMGGAAVVADHAQHVLAVLLVAGEGAEQPRHLGRGGVADAGHDGGERARDLAAGIGIVGQARRHQQAAEIGVAETQRAVTRRRGARSRARGTAPSAPRFRARPSTAAPHARSRRGRTAPGQSSPLALRGVACGTRAGSSTRDCRRCRRGTCIPSTDCWRGSAPRPGRCASR